MVTSRLLPAVGKNTVDKRTYRRMCKHLNLLKEFFAIVIINLDNVLQYSFCNLSFENAVDKREPWNTSNTESKALNSGTHT